MDAISNISIKIVGVGGGGSNTVNTLLPLVKGVGFAAINTDVKALENSRAREKILIGKSLTKGLSTGGDTRLGKAAALSDFDSLETCVGGVDLLIICASLGGGTGSAAAPLLAQAARDSGAKVISFCTMPFEIEGSAKVRNAQIAFESMRKNCDAAIALPNELMLTDSSNVSDALREANRSLASALAILCGAILSTGIINIDFGAIKRLFESRLPNRTLFAFASAAGENFAARAIAELSDCPMLKASSVPHKAKRLVVSVRCGKELPFNALKEILISTATKFSSGDEVIFGTVLDDEFSGKIEICVIGVEEVPEEKPEPVKPTQLELSAEFLASASASPKTMRSRGRKSKEVKKTEDKQSSFDTELSEQRGYFSDTEPNIHNGQDLDVPAYLRRGIRIAVKKA